MKTFLLYVLAALFIYGCTPPQASENEREVMKSSQFMDSIFQDYYEERLELYPLQATSIGDNRYNDILPNDISEGYRQKLKGFYQKYLGKINQVDRNSLSREEKLNYDIFKWDMEINLESFEFDSHLLPVNQFWGTPLTFAQLGSGASDQPFKTVADYENFLGRVNGFQEWVDTAIANMKKGMEKGFVQPEAIVVKILPQYNSMLVDNVDRSVFYGPVTNMPESFDDSTKARLTKSYEKAIREQVIPSYKKLYDFLKTTYLPAARSTSGINGIPEGEDLYLYLVKFWTTTEMKPDEIFEQGKKEVARIRGEMGKVKNEVGFEGSLQEFFEHLNTDPKFYPYKTDEEILWAYRAIEAKIEPNLPEYFSLFPKTGFEIRQTEEFREASASAEYQPGSLDGSRPGIFYVPITDPSKYNNTQMESLFLHEAIPGHHFQVSLQQENKDVPAFRRINWYGAYGEGWALYSEGLGNELGLYTDPYQYFGRLSHEMHRAVRLVVDVGLHTKGWTREQAIEYSLENEAISEEDATAEIERYMVIPAQALSYKTGELKLLRLKEKILNTMGDSAISAFHDEVLKDGSMPLKVLERKLEDWMNKVQ